MYQNYKKFNFFLSPVTWIDTFVHHFIVMRSLSVQIQTSESFNGTLLRWMDGASFINGRVWIKTGPPENITKNIWYKVSVKLLVKLYFYQVKIESRIGGQADTQCIWGVFCYIMLWWFAVLLNRIFIFFSLLQLQWSSKLFCISLNSWKITHNGRVIVPLLVDKSVYLETLRTKLQLLLFMYLVRPERFIVMVIINSVISMQSIACTINRYIFPIMR